MPFTRISDFLIEKDDRGRPAIMPIKILVKMYGLHLQVIVASLCAMEKDFNPKA